MLKIAYCGYDYYASCLAALMQHENVQLLKDYACTPGGNKWYSAEVVRRCKAHKEDTTMDAIVDRMCAKYDAPRETIAADAMEILGTLRRINALEE